MNSRARRNGGRRSFTAGGLAAMGGLALLLILAGCAHTRTIQSRGASVWGGLGVELTLPPGVWRVEPLDKNQGAFFSAPGKGNILLQVLKTDPREPEWMALRKLFVEFDEKKPIRRWSEKMPDGGDASCAAYDVVVDGRTERVRACAATHGQRRYLLAEWGFDPASPALITMLRFTSPPEMRGAP